MRGLPLNDKGYPVPWFVDWIDGKPEFRAMDPRKWRRAVKDRLCWLCGEKLGRYMAFVAGPMCGVNRTSSEPPSHRDCALYAARACPFLTLPRALRRDAGLPEHVQTRGAAMTENNIVGGIAITRNPGVAMVWTTERYDVYRAGNGMLIKMGEPATVEWFAEGRPATRDEVEASMASGLPHLQRLADEEGPLAQAELQRLTQVFMRYLPP